jgi:quinoprotein glucose dehydrogenase
MTKPGGSGLYFLPHGLSLWRRMSRRPDTSSGRLSKMSPAAPSKILRFFVFSTLLITPIAPRLASAQSSTTKRDWAVNGGEPNNTHSSPLAQINRENVGQLRVAWSYDTGETGGLQTSPIIVDGVLYGLSPSQKVFAVDAATGKVIWNFDSGIKGTQPVRGLAYWANAGHSDKRIIVGVMNFVYALDTATGKPIPTFGSGGRIDLRDNLSRKDPDPFVSLTSPVVIYKDMFIAGGRNSETLPAAPGDVRAFDVRTGKVRWAFHTIPQPGEVGYNTWPQEAYKTIGAANNWAGMTVDVQRGIVFVPTGSAAFDFYGGNRVGDDLFANCLLALDANTGKRIWHFQAVHHDIWDRDFPSHPVLVTIHREGQRDGQGIEAVAQTSKQGFVYLFDRATGAPLFPLETKRYPASTIPGEVASVEQSLPSKPAPYARQLLREDMLSNRTPDIHKWALDQFHEARSEGQFVPFSVGKETVIFPGFDGGAEWGGPALDPDFNILYVNANEMAWMASLDENKPGNTAKSIYLTQCAICHGDNRAGSPPAFPSLVGVGDRLTPAQIASTIRTGKGRMNGFPGLSADQVAELVDFLTGAPEKEVSSSAPAPTDMKYRFTGYRRFLDPDGYPAVAPPWGTLNAINLNTGEYVWKINLGEYPALAAQGMKDTGSENYGGPIVTAGGIVFIGATNYDQKFRAFDKATGKLLWETKLPFSGNATPATYLIDGKQYVVIAAGGGKDPKHPSGGVYVAFALPESGAKTSAAPQQ